MQSHAQNVDEVRAFFGRYVWKAGIILCGGALCALALMGYDAATCAPATARVEKVDGDNVQIRFATPVGQTLRLWVSSGKLNLIRSADQRGAIEKYFLGSTVAVAGADVPIVYRGAEGNGRPYVSSPTSPGSYLAFCLAAFLGALLWLGGRSLQTPRFPA